MIGTPHRILFR